MRLPGKTLRVALTVLLTAAIGRAAERQSVTILSTTDLHANIYPIDYATGRPDNRGLAKVATVVKSVRREAPGLILINTGDALAGTALAYHYATGARRTPNPVIAAMNSLRFDAMVVGNHEYDFGWPLLEDARQSARFPWLAANVYHRGSERTFFDPYVVKVIGPVRIGILGLTTAAAPNWDDPARFLARIEIRDPLAEAGRWVRRLREQERVDVVVVAMHMGLEADPSSGVAMPGQLPGENQALAIAGGIPGIDVMFLGHTHREIPSLVVNGVLLTQPALWGRSVVRVDLTMEQAGRAWRVRSKTARTIPVEGVPADRQVLDGAAAEHRATERWLDQVIGQSAVDLRAGEERFRDAPLLDFVQRVQLTAGKAEVSLAECLNPSARIAPGPVTVRQIFGLYAIEKKLVTLEVTGRQLRAALEHSARYFRRAAPGTTPADWVDPDAASYNYYIAEGVTYDLDATKPLGQRIVNLRYGGKEVGDDQRFPLATNNYLANGAAGYGMFLEAPVLARSDKDLRELLIEQVRREGRLPVITDGNWRLLPVISNGNRRP